MTETHSYPEKIPAGMLLEFFEKDGNCILSVPDVTSYVDVPWELVDAMPNGVYMQLDGKKVDKGQLGFALGAYKDTRDRMPAARRHKSDMYDFDF